MTHSVGIYYGTVALCSHLTRITVSDIKSEYILNHVSRNNIRKNQTRLTGAMDYDIVPRITQLHTFLLHSIHCESEFTILQDTIFVHTY